MHTKFRSENMKGKDHLEDIHIDRKRTLEWILEKYGGKVWTGLIGFRIETNGRLLETQ